MTEIGLIFHWGLYSVPAYDCIQSVYKRKMKNGSEWYLKRLMESGTYRPISGWKETQEYHKNNYGNIDYYEFKNEFGKDVNEITFNKWMELAKQIGASYVILTAKHHDGFCLWNTETTDKKTEKDYVEMFKKSALKYNLKFGIYYSWSEFLISCNKKYVSEIICKQMDELEKYNPDIFWFDGQWSCKTQFCINKINDICNKIKINNPNIMINDRIPRNDKKYDDLDFLGDATYRVYSDRCIPNDKPKVKWEHINTIGYSWGINKDQKTCDYKSGDELYKLYTKISSMDGNFLINLGPNANGTLDENEVNSLIDFSKMIK